jgi:iron transport multicopper oxidase
VWKIIGGIGQPVIGVNGAWPWPSIRASVGDTIKVHLTNSLGNQTTGMHWHGIAQTSTIWMDGPSMVTQCPIPPNMTFTYEFIADSPGTFWCKL